MTINIFMYIYIGENAHWEIYAPPPCKSLHKKKIFFFFHFRCILLQISHKKCFFISISILGRSGVKTGIFIKRTCISIFGKTRVCRSVKTVHTNLFAQYRKLHKFATTKKTILLDMHRHKTYMYINFQQNQVKTQVVTACTCTPPPPPNGHSGRF